MVFHFSTARRVAGMWESRSVFQRLWARWETRFGFPRRAQPVISAAVFMRSSSVEGRRRVFVWLLACSARRWCRCGHQPCAVSLRLSCQASGKPRNPGAAAILPRASRSGDKSGAPSLFCLLSFPVSHKADESSHVAGSNRGYEARHRSLSLFQTIWRPASFSEHIRESRVLC